MVPCPLLKDLRGSERRPYEHALEPSPCGLDGSPGTQTRFRDLQEVGPASTEEYQLVTGRKPEVSGPGFEPLSDFVRFERWDQRRPPTRQPVAPIALQFVIPCNRTLDRLSGAHKTFAVHLTEPEWPSIASAPRGRSGQQVWDGPHAVIVWPAPS